MRVSQENDVIASNKYENQHLGEKLALVWRECNIVLFIR